MTLLNFQSYLTSKAPSTPPAPHTLTEAEQQLLKQVASLPILSEAAQGSQLESILTVLSVADIDDTLRLRLMAIVMTAMENLIASLRRQYIYEVGPLSSSQLDAANQVKSLYYLAVAVFEAVVRRESVLAQYQQQQQAEAPSPSFWQRLMSSPSATSFTLAVAIYQSLLMYQNILCENAICYQKTPPNIWLSLNQLYYLACQQHIAHVDLTSQVVTRQAISIHQLYCQMCLYSLLNVLAMRRPTILLIQRLLPEWARHIHATIEPQTKTRIFIDLKSDNSPQYLTAVTSINPYESHHDCLFVELEPLAVYLKLRQHELLATDKALNEYRLVTKILMAITHRYLARQPNTINKYTPKKRGTLINGFNDIHYYVADKRSLTDMVAAPGLSIDYLPRYDTAPRKNSTPRVIEIEIHDCTGKIAHFRSLRLLTAQDIVAQQGVVSADAHKYHNNMDHSQDLLIPPLTEIFEPITLEEAEKTDESVLTKLLATAPPRLRMMSLFLLGGHQHSAQSLQTSHKDSWTLGVIRWLTIDEEYIEAEGQILGFRPTACALRLDNRDNRDSRSESFVPALLLAAEEKLETTSSLLVPTSHFKINDKVIIRLNEKQKSLRLQSVILSTEEFTQYEVIIL